jgi:hypothetical protein
MAASDVIEIIWLKVPSLEQKLAKEGEDKVKANCNGKIILVPSG